MHAAEYGISTVPDIPDDARDEATGVYAALGQGVWINCRKWDPVIAERLQPTDKQRLIRALEVVLHTGKALSDWQNMPREGG